MDCPLSSLEALARLREGNRRFVERVVSLDALLSHARRAEQALSQQPFAVVLGCSDSRAPAEFVFDQGLGDLFVIRVAGNIAAPSQIGSIEFAVERFGVKLVVVLGHSNCGAVRATVEHCRAPAATSAGLRAIVDRIAPTVAPLVAACGCSDDERLVAEAVRENVRATVRELRCASPMLQRHLDGGELLIVGGEYDLSSGAVAFFNGVPAACASARAA